MKTGNIACGFVVVCLLSVVGSVVNGAEGNAEDAGEEAKQPDAKVTEILNRSPTSKKARDLRDGARKAQKDYFAARADNADIKNLEKQMVKLIGGGTGTALATRQQNRLTTLNDVIDCVQANVVALQGV